MKFLFSFRVVFWGLILITAGIMLIVNTILQVHFPVFAFLLSFVFIYVGIEILIAVRMGGKWAWSGFRSIKYEPGSGDQEYNISFGGASIDLGGVTLKDKNVNIRINCSFGGASVLISPDLPAKITGTASFGGIVFPDHSHAAFGSAGYQSAGFRQDQPYLEIKAQTSFSGLRFVTSLDNMDNRDNWRQWRRHWREERHAWRRAVRRRDRD